MLVIMKQLTKMIWSEFYSDFTLMNKKCILNCTKIIKCYYLPKFDQTFFLNSYICSSNIAA